MLDETLQERFLALIEVKFNERRREFPIELGRIDAEAAKNGMFHSSVRLLNQHRAHAQELNVRAIQTWQSLVRVFQTFGAPLSNSLREDLKNIVTVSIKEIYSELSQSLAGRLKNMPSSIDLSLDKPCEFAIAEHDIEIDLYVDSLVKNNSTKTTEAMTSSYNFYGNVGAVQTAAGAVANIVQNLSSNESASILEAIRQVKNSIESSQTIESRQKSELIEIADECSVQMASANPNNTKLLTLFNLLGTAIQSIASAQPAYQALKLAILPLGITLP